MEDTYPMAEDKTSSLDDLLEEIKEEKKKSRELAERAERQVTLALSASIRLVKDDSKEETCNNKDNKDDKK
jgi:hypothetical protein